MPRRSDDAEPAFAETLSTLTQHLARRAAAVPRDPVAAAAARRAALHAHDRAFRQRSILAGLAMLGALSVVVLFALPLLAPAVPPPLPERPVAAPSAGARKAPPPSADVTDATARPTAAPRATAMAPPMTTATPMAMPVPAPPAAPPPAPLDRAEVRDVQVRLRGFGFDPGPPDGDVGPRTLSAARLYRESRNQPQTDAVDRDLLDQLRLDPAPTVAPPLQVAQRRPRHPAAPQPGGARPANPFDRLGRWLDSLVR